MHIRNEETAAERLRTRLIILYKQPTVIEAALGVFQAVGCPRWDVRVCGTTLVSSRIIIFHGKWECLLYPVLYQVLHSAFYYLLIFFRDKGKKILFILFSFSFHAISRFKVFTGNSRYDDFFPATNFVAISIRRSVCINSLFFWRGGD